MKRPNRKALVLPLLALTITASVFLLQNLSLLREAPFSLTRAWHTPSAVSVAPDGSMAVIENSKMTVSLLDSQGRLRARIYGGSYDTDSFYYAEHVATDGESVVIAEVRHAVNSTFVESERLLRYAMDGSRMETLYEVNYQQAERPGQLGRIRNVHIDGATVSFAWVDGPVAGISVCENGSARVLDSRTIEADRFVLAAYDPTSGVYCFTTKKGKIGVTSIGKPIEWLAYGDGTRVPWSVGLAADGSPIVSELIGGTVDKPEGANANILWRGGQVYELNASDGRIAFTDEETVYVLTDSGALLSKLRNIRLSPALAAGVVLAWLSAAYLGAGLLWLLFWLFRLTRKLPISETRRRMIIAAGSVLVTVVLVMAFFFSFMQKQLQRQAISALSGIAESISVNSSEMLGRRLATIRSLKDYLSADYNAIRAYMNAFCDASYENGGNLYYVLYRFDNSMLWGVMDYEDTTGVLYPYTSLAGTVYRQVIDTGKIARVEGSADIYGMWSFAVAPVYSQKGEIVGLVEIGTNQYGDVVARNQLMRDVLTGVLVALMMAMLAFNELTAFRDYRAQRRVFKAEGNERIALGFIRALIFLVFMADNMDAAYIPQLSAALGANTAGLLNVGLASALPMSVQLLAIGLSAFLSGRILDHSRPRRILFGGLGLQLAGVALALIALQTGQYWFLVLAKAVGGLGTGASVVTCNALPGRCDEEGEQQRLIAGLNVGIVTGVVLGSSVGGYLADYLTYPAAYAGSALCVLFAAALAWPSLRGVSHVTVEYAPDDPGRQKGSTRRFLRKPRVLIFLLCIMLPYMLMMYFKDYLFPLFASGLGKTESVIGSVMLLAGMLAILLGDVLPGALLSRAAAWDTARLSSLASVYALGLFALRPTFETAVVTLCLLGVSASFGYAAQGVYYTQLIKTGNITDGKAMGLFSLFDNLGQTSGPLGLSALLFLGVALESGVIALAAAGLLGFASLLNRVGGKVSDDGR